MEDEIPRGSVTLCCEYVQGVCNRHPYTDEPIHPPFALSAVCSKDAVGWVRSSIVKLNESRGWVGRISQHPLYKEDEHGEQVQG